ncbi:hypothetical protein FRC01_007045 [Tulasnella sp. 417]|nr:hypothetical protein FRC01_007045 [Tulasnella sp. 417]
MARPRLAGASGAAQFQNSISDQSAPSQHSSSKAGAQASNSSNDESTAIPPERIPPSSLQLIEGGVRPHVYDFRMEDIMNPRLLYCPRTGLVLPPKPNGVLTANGTIDDMDVEVKPIKGPKKRRPKPKPVLSDDEDGEGHDPNIPRPPNKFILFRCDVLTRNRSLEMSKAEHSLATADISGQWKAQPPHVRQHYQYLSGLHKIVHKEKYPNYKFKPMTKAQKQTLEAQRRAAAERQIRKIGGHPNATTDSDAPSPRPRAGFRTPSTTGAPGSSRDPTPKRGMDPIKRKYQPYYSATTWGPTGPPPDWTPDGGPALPGSQEAEDDDEEEDRVEADGPQEEMPLFSAQTSLYQPPPGADARQQAMVKQQDDMQKRIANRPQIPSTTFDFELPNNPWPGMAHGVNWSQTAPLPQSSEAQDWLSPATTGTAASVDRGSVQPGYASWKTETPQDQEVTITLPASTINEGLGLVGTALPGALDGLQLAGSANSTLTMGPAPGLFDGTMSPAMMHAPTTSANEDNLHAPLTVSFAGQSFETFLASGANGDLAQGAVGLSLGSVDPTASNSDVFWPGFIADSFKLPGDDLNSAAAPAAAVTLDTQAFSNIQGLNPSTYGYYTGSTGAGALPTAEIPSFLVSLGFDVDVNQLIDLPQGSATSHETWKVAADWIQNGEAVQQGQPAPAQAAEEDPNMSFGSMVSFSGGVDEDEETQKPHTEVVSASSSPVEANFNPQQMLASEGDHRSPPPPYAPPAGAVNFAGRRVGGNWRPPFKQGQRTVSVQSAQSSHSVIVHEVGDYEEEADEDPADVGYVQATVPGGHHHYHPGSAKSRQASATSQSTAHSYNSYHRPQQVAFGGQHVVSNPSSQYTPSPQSTAHPLSDVDGARPPPIPKGSRPPSISGSSVSSRTSGTYAKQPNQVLQPIS